ncbi:hypothetical protein D1007_46954 [Hordeum vulgare]|nr:hypothetical protein D1007_46954 [Hordeum vulgare]KAI4987683.1 hypothetical protein ZWY2020_028441 [Hordeum vulgare]
MVRVTSVAQGEAVVAVWPGRFGGGGAQKRGGGADAAGCDAQRATGGDRVGGYLTRGLRRRCRGEARQRWCDAGWPEAEVTVATQTVVAEASSSEAMLLRRWRGAGVLERREEEVAAQHNVSA